MKPSSVVVDLHYLPSLEYFTCLLNFEQVFIEREEHFQKQSFRNRCYIRGANKVQKLSIPVKKGSQKTKIKDVQIDNQQKWQNEHWRSIHSAYGKAPFFEYFKDQFESVFSKSNICLFDLNYELLTLCLNILQVSVNISFTSEYVKNYDSGFYDARSTIHPKKNYKTNSFYQPFPYYQIFGKEFVPNLSIIDLIFCEGINSRQILFDSRIAEQT